MRFRFMSLAMIAMLLIAAITPTASADAALPASYAPGEARGDDPPDARMLSASRRRARQVSGLPWSRVRVERNLLRNRGR